MIRMASRHARLKHALQSIVLTPIAFLILATIAAAVASLIWLLRVQLPGVGRVLTTDQRYEQVLTDLRDSYFADIVTHFDPAVQREVSADQIQFDWLGRTAFLGPLSEWKLVQSHSSGSVETRLYNVTFAYGSLPVTIDMSPGGEVQGLWFAFARNTAPVMTPAYANPHVFKAEKVTVGSAPNLCDGILTTPTAVHPRFPAAVLIAGSGPLDKHGTIGPNHPYADLAEGLSTRGIVVLRYDKRTYSHPNIVTDSPARFTVEQEYLEDGIAAVALLRRQPDVDGNRIFVIGHSGGAMLAPEIAERAAPVAGVVMLAPGGAPLLDIVIRQLRYEGASRALIAETEKDRLGVNSGELAPSYMVSLLGYPVGYLRDLNRRDEIGVARHLGVPILIMHGGRDYQVIDEDIAAWRSGLKGTPEVSFREFPSLNHFFIAGTGPPAPAEYANASHIDEEVILTIVDFILQKTAFG
jgi:uncharacterized protein